VLPRFVPTDHFYFSYGFRIGGRWEGVTGELTAAVRDSLPRLSRLASLDGLLEAAARPDFDIRHVELRLCVASIREDLARFTSMSERVRGWKTTSGWEAAVLSRCENLIQAVDQRGLPYGATLLKQRRGSVDQLLAS
jgi:hypothetical protein